MGTPRSEPYIWTTWLTRLVVGEESCEWAAWFKAHHEDYNKVPDTFDQTTWQIEHTALLRGICERLESEDYVVFLERQNHFRLRSEKSGITLGGQPDVIAIKGNHGLVCDAKTGQDRASNHIQVMIYMWAIPYAFHQYRNMNFEGRVVYGDHEVEIPASAINESFTGNLGGLIKQVGGSKPLRKVPSAGECGFCRIAGTECPERIERHDDEQREQPAVDLY
jgi:hypothetical protein